MFFYGSHIVATEIIKKKTSKTHNFSYFFHRILNFHNIIRLRLIIHSLSERYEEEKEVTITGQMKTLRVQQVHVVSSYYKTLHMIMKTEFVYIELLAYPCGVRYEF